MSRGYQPPTHLALVVEKVKNAIHWIAQLVSLILIRWIVIYPVDSAIQRLNNRGLIITDTSYKKRNKIDSKIHGIRKETSDNGLLTWDQLLNEKKKDKSSIDTRLPENTI